ncbi:MAG: alpha/beta fold hydrolase [Candidatus Aminicenantales bacterium]
MMMKRKSLVILGGCLLAAGAFLLQAGASAQAENELTHKARQFMAALEKGDFNLAVRDFDETMLKVSGPDKLEPFWKEQFPKQVGSFKKQTAARREKLGAYEVVLVTCEFEKATLDARVVFDKAGKIAGFSFVPSLPPAKYELPAYADAAKFEEREVTVGSGEWALPGTLTMPRGDGPFPGLVLVHGSGANDRDESLGPNKPFKDLAWGLASRGIAVLRYDKRSKVYGAKIVADPKLEASLTVKEETIDDALTAAALLQKTAKIDKGRVFILGHSLGGFLMPRIAVAAKPMGIAGFISMAGLTRPLDDTILRQIMYLSGGDTSEGTKKRLESIKEEVAKIKAFTEADRGTTVKVLGAMPSYWLDVRGYNPPELAKTLSKPMLILQGSRDYQVTTEDFDNWKAALGSRQDVEFHLYPKLNHFFFEGQGLPTPNEYIQIHGSVAPYVIEDIAAWILKR